MNADMTRANIAYHTVTEAVRTTVAIQLLPANKNMADLVGWTWTDTQIYTVFLRTRVPAKTVRLSLFV